MKAKSSQNSPKNNAHDKQRNISFVSASSSKVHKGKENGVLEKFKNNSPGLLGKAHIINGNEESFNSKVLKDLGRPFEEKLEDIVKEAKSSDSNKMFKTVRQMFSDFRSGTGPEHRSFGPKTLESRYVGQSYTVKRAMDKYYDNMRKEGRMKGMLRADPYIQGDFGLKGALSSGTNIMSQFIG